MKTQSTRLGITCLLFSVLAVPIVAIPDVPTAATQTFLEGDSARRATMSGDRLSAFYGTILASDDVPGDHETADDFVDAFLSANADAFGVDDVNLEFVGKLTIRDGKFAVYTYRQLIAGLPVHGSALKVLVRLESEIEKISYLAFRLSPHPAEQLPSENEISAQDAIDEVANSDDYGHLTNFTDAGEAANVVFEDTEGTPHRVWRFRGGDDDEVYEFFVDSTTGEILAGNSLVAYFDGTVTVQGKTDLCCHKDRPDWPACCPATPLSSDCCCNESHPEYPCVEQCCGWLTSPQATMPLAGIQVTQFSHSCPAGDEDWSNAQLTDEAGQHEFSGSDPRVAARLVGEFVSIGSCSGAALHPVFCSTPFGSSILFDFNPLSTGTLCQLSEVNAYLTGNYVRAWFKTLQPTFTGIDGHMPITFTQQGGGGRYLPEPPRISLSGPFVPSAGRGGNPSIVAHEYGHYIMDRMGIGYQGTFIENLSDTVASLALDISCYGYNTDSTRPMECVRDFDPPSQSQYPDGHRLIPEVFWDLRKELLHCSGDTQRSCSAHGDCDLGTCVNQQCTGDTASCQDDEDCQLGPCIDLLTEQLFADALPLLIGIPDGFEASALSVLLAVLSVDDDDADLTSDPPTPHYAEIFDAFAVQHGFPDPLLPVAGDGSVQVGWEGPTAPPSEEDGDFTIYYSFTPPYVVLTRTRKSGVNVDRWFVGRTDPLTDEPLDLIMIRTAWDQAIENNIVVHIGTQPDKPCRSASVIRIEPQGNKYSNLIVDLKGNVGGGLECFSGTEGGGLVSGTIAGEARRITASAIGSSDDLGGSLTVGTLFRATLEGISPPGAQDVSVLSSEEFGGVVTVNGSTDGHFRVTGNINGSVIIAGDMAGDILADEDRDGVGIIRVGTTSNPTIKIDGDFSGNICAANLAYDQPVPSTILQVTGSFLGTVCPLRGTILPPAPHTAAKNRYLSINPRTNYSRELALKVRLDSMKRCEVDEAIPCEDAGDCPSGECEEHDDVEDYWWVAEPFDASCEDDNHNPLAGNPQCTGVDFVARLSDTAVSLDWSAYPVLHIADCQIAPTATYAITAYDETAEEESTELLVSTIARPDSKFYGDVVGALTSSGWTPPQGVVNFNDIQAVIFGMQGVPTAPHRSWLDIFGPFEGCVPDFVIGASDLQAVVAAFGGATWLAGEYNLYPGDCPSTKTAIQPIGNAVTFSLDVSSGFIDPEEPVYVDVFIGSVDDLGAYEVALEVTGGTEGWLILTDITVDTQRGDYVFGASSSYIAANLAEARVGNVLASGGVSVTGPK